MDISEVLFHHSGEERNNTLENRKNNTYLENESKEEAIAQKTAPDAEIIEVTEIEAEDEEDISAVAEMITAAHNPYSAEAMRNTGAFDVPEEIRDDGDEESEKRPKDYDGFFEGFTVKKSLATAIIVLAVLAVLLSSMVAAARFADDKTKRLSDYDMVLSEEAEAAREKSETRAPDDTAFAEVEKFKVTLDFYDRDDIELFTDKMVLSDILKNAGVTLEEGEESTLSLDTMIGAETTVQFDKYEYKTEVLSEAIEYESERRESDTIWLDTVNYIQYGVEGKAEITYNIKLKNGEEISREEVSRETVEWPQNEIYEVGVGGTLVGNDGKTYSYSLRKTVKATYYYVPSDPYTYLGNKPDHTTLAVDKNVIPLGTWLYVKNNRYDFGLRQAQDIGGAVVGDMIDIWLDGSEAGYASFVNEGIVYDMDIYYIN